MWTGAWFSRRDRPSTERPVPTEVVDESVPEARAWTPRAAVEPAPGCMPEAERACHQGDSWWIDSCGVMYAPAQECGDRRCTAGECDPPPPGCDSIGGLGRCDGERAIGCDAGYPFEVDCAALGQRCAMSEEGPICREPSPDDCGATAVPRCDDDTLFSCVEGRWQAVDCRALGGTCGRPPGGLLPACVRPLPPSGWSDGCEDACGCPPPRTEEVCDGRDNDEDGFIDESGTCEPVDLVAFVIVDADGRTSYAPEDLEQEVARLNRLFAREDDFGLQFRLVETVRLAEPTWISLSADRLDELVRSPTIVAAREEFYVPIVFTDEVVYRGAPRPGLSTVPNGTCGGQRRIASQQPPLGVIAVAKRRWPTTLAHELGHFFGLCHTHGDHPAPIVTVAGGDEAYACAEACAVDGDGVCDTPEDPGPSECVVDLECGVQCGDGAQPDAGNIMGYYPQCRGGFSEQQALLMRTTLALRRGWHGCLRGRGCGCEFGEGGCPEQMSCRRFVDREGGFRKCWFDGVVVAGGECERSSECAGEAICLRKVGEGARCVRVCGAGVECECVGVAVGGVEMAVCGGDFG